MARALVSGLLAGDSRPSRISVVEPAAASRDWWQNHQPSVQIVERCDAPVMVFAVKPNLVATAMSQHETADRLVVSIAAGVTLDRLCDAAGHRRVARVMPNTPALVGAGASAFCVADDVTPRDLAWVRELLKSVGTVDQIDESLINAVTGLSGSGPAYVCLIVESLADGGVAAGLPRPLAMQLAAQTVMGTAEMILRDGRHPGQLKDAVASPGGTTIAGLASMEACGVRSAMIKAVAAAKAVADRLGD